MQKVNYKTGGFLIGFCILNLNLSIAQDLTQIQFDYFEDILEENADNEDNSSDLSALMEYINDLIEHPVNLNMASEEELSLLPFLNDFQIASLVDYRRKNGLIFSVYELQYIPGFRQEEVELIQPFVYIGESAKADSFSIGGKQNFKHILVLRYQRILENQKGYFAIPY